MTSKLAALALVALGVAGCGGGAHAGGSSGATAGGNTVIIQGFKFAPATLAVKVGTTVTWTQKDSTIHTATDSAAFDSGNLSHGMSYSHRFTQPGTYHYLCAIHNFMTGTVVVTS